MSIERRGSVTTSEMSAILSMQRARSLRMNQKSSVPMEIRSYYVILREAEHSGARRRET